MNDKNKKITFGIDEELTKQFKARCALIGRSMSDILVDLIKKFLRSQTKGDTNAN